MKANRSGALIRVSTGMQDAKLQRAAILAQARTDGREITKWYELDGVSAFHGGQEQALADALHDAQTGEIRALYVFNTDRADRRGIRYTLQYRYEVMQAGAVLISATQPYCKDDTPEAEELLARDASRAQSESAVKQMRQNLLVIPEIRGNGAYFGKPPFGYRITGEKHHKRLEPTDIGREYIPQIFERLISGASLTELAWWLDSCKIRFRADGSPAPWWPAQVARLVRNPVYIGHCQTDAGQWVHECEALVDPTTFRKANEAIVDRNRKRRGPRNLPENYAMLRGAIRCAECGSPMNRHASKYALSSRGRPPKLYYRCRSLGPDRSGCGNNVGVEAVDAAVSRIIAERFHKPVMLRVLVRGTDHQAALDAVAQELVQLSYRRLPRAEEQAERERLWAEEDRLAALPVEEDRWELVPTGEFYDELYAALPEYERGAWLVRQGFRVLASKAEVTVAQGTTSAALSLANPVA